MGQTKKFIDEEFGIPDQSSYIAGSLNPVNNMNEKCAEYFLLNHYFQYVENFYYMDGRKLNVPRYLNMIHDEVERQVGPVEKGATRLYTEEVPTSSTKGMEFTAKRNSIYTNIFGIEVRGGCFNEPEVYNMCTEMVALPALQPRTAVVVCFGASRFIARAMQLLRQQGVIAINVIHDVEYVDKNGTDRVMYSNINVEREASFSIDVNSLLNNMTDEDKETILFGED